MKTFATSITIRADPGAIWALLTDAGAYPAWNTTVERIDGRIAPGGKLAIHTRAQPGRAFPVRVQVFEPPARMTWVGGMPFGLFRGTRSFVLEPLAGEGTRFSMSEVYDGLLASLLGRMLPDLQPAFDAFARDLRQRAERSA